MQNRKTVQSGIYRYDSNTKHLIHLRRNTAKILVLHLPRHCVRYIYAVR